jgi:hypothetical protein
MDLLHTFHVVQREMINNNNNLAFCKIGGEEYIQKGFIKEQM